MRDTAERWIAGGLLLVCCSCGIEERQTVCREGARSACYTGPPGTASVGVCRSGWKECRDGVFGPCLEEVLPHGWDGTAGSASEGDLCDGLDNDCDGVVDDVEMRPACRRQLGVCGGAKMSCKEGSWRECTDADYRDHAFETLCGQPDAPACCREDADACYVLEETSGTCDGLDNDCNGAIDDVQDGTCACHNGERRDCPREHAPDEGECVHGFYDCIEGRWLKDDVCVEPEPERCDGLDNDCDGVTDGAAAADTCREYPRNHADLVTCEDGVCIWSCRDGFADCNQDLSPEVPPGGYEGDGCETRLGTDTNCSACGDDCSAYHDHSIRRCQDGACRMIGCEHDFVADCNDDPADGCETVLVGNDEHCGFCANDCHTRFPHADGYCLNETCIMTGCDEADWVDCNQEFGDGCECNIQTHYCWRDIHCCETPCLGPCDSCTSGVCSYIWNDVTTWCNGDYRCNRDGECKKILGVSCQEDTECISGHCKDGVCCNTTCDTPCRNCATGTCALVTEGEDPPECTDGSTCDADGVCQ